MLTKAENLPQCLRKDILEEHKQKEEHKASNWRKIEFAVNARSKQAKAVVVFLKHSLTYSGLSVSLSILLQ